MSTTAIFKQQNNTQKSSSPARSVALDALRGLTVALMLLVNNVALGEFTPKQLQHAAWGGGVHVADLVFPWFLFCSGAALGFAWTSAQKRGLGRAAWTRRALIRAALLYAIGCVLTSIVAHAPVFSLGVLQLIGVAGLVAAWLEPEEPMLRLVIAMVLLLTYWIFLRFVPMPGLETGTFVAGHNTVARLNGWLDGFGLRGLPSVVPTAALVLLGSLVGKELRKPSRLTLMAVVSFALGLLWNLDLEFNKPHWTPSYILFGTATATSALAAIVLLERRFGTAWCWPLSVFGSNALLAYVAPILVKVLVLQGLLLPNGKNLQDSMLGFLIANLGRVGGGWFYTLVYIAVWWLVFWGLQRKKWFWRV